MKVQDSITQIASLIGRHKSTISRELRRNACAVEPRVRAQAAALLRLQWSPEQVASKLPVSHEMLYQHVYADKTQDGSLWKNLRCQKQKRKCYASGRDRRGYAVIAKVKTLTYDNGKEFCGYALFDEALKSTGYFARPFASWERGSHVGLGFCQNFNGLLRQYVPKKRLMQDICDEEIKIIENRLNKHPRKRLGFRTPAEVFHQSLSRVALRA